jgi:beta-galactosidase/beta-glucuronidase
VDLNLNGSWLFFIDEINQGLVDRWYTLAWITANAESAQKIEVPSNFNTIPGLFRYTGVVWYYQKIPQLEYYPTSHDYYLEFDGVNYCTDVWINGRKIGHHEGGFLPFRFEFNPRLLSLKSDNWIAVRVEASLQRDRIPGMNEDWFNWGGIHRNVQIVILENTRIRDIKIYSAFEGKQPSTATVYINYMIKNLDAYLERCLLNGEEPRVDYEVYFLGRYINGEPEQGKVMIQTGSRPIGGRMDSEKALEHIPHDIDSISTYFQNVTLEKDEDERNLERFFLKREELPKESGESLIEKTPNPISSNIKEKIKALQKNKQNLRKTISQSKIIQKENRAFFALMDHFEISIQSPLLWAPDTPDLYEITLRLRGVDEDKTKRFGIRTIKTQGPYLLLNNQPIRLKGICLHEEQDPIGRHYPNEQRRSEIKNMKRLGLNALRTAHYPHDKDLIRIADEEGLLIQEEIPLYWNCQFKNPAVVKLAAQMLYDLISRDFNHPSVIIWSIGNEIPIEQYSCELVTKLLLKWVQKLDPTRIATYVSGRYCSDTVRRSADVNCINMYFGWYYLTTYQLNFFLDATHYTNPNKPWIMTEFGADAKLGDHDLNHKYSEENQARTIAHTIRILNSKPYVAGWFIWVYRDFRSPLRTNQYQQGFNRKGIVDEDNHPKLISKVLARVANETIPKIRNYRALAYFFYYGFRWLEWLLYNHSVSLGYFIQEKMMKKFYGIGLK